LFDPLASVELHRPPLPINRRPRTSASPGGGPTT